MKNRTLSFLAATGLFWGSIACSEQQKPTTGAFQTPSEFKISEEKLQDKVKGGWAGQTIGCPDGVFCSFYIDAAINGAYVVIGLLYGEGDFYKTINISARRHELFWNYQLSMGTHKVTFKWLNPQKEVAVHFGEKVIYAEAEK